MVKAFYRRYFKVIFYIARNTFSQFLALFVHYCKDILFHHCYAQWIEAILVRIMLRIFSLLLSLSLGLILGCGGSSSSSPPPPPPPQEENQTRPFKMGFTPWLYEASLDAQTTTYDRLHQHGDIIKHHLMSGLPWQEALDQTAYHPNVEAEINGRLSRTANSMEVFLAIDSLNTLRDGLSPNWGETVNMPLEGEWANRSWNSPEVISAYINFSLDMIDRFQPTYFEYGTEVSELILNDPAAYLDYLVFAQAVYTAVRTAYPNLKIMTSVALKAPGSIQAGLIEASYSSILDYTDVVGISVYPYAFYEHNDKGDPVNLPSDWLSQINNLRGSKPVAISETGWIAEDLSIPSFQFSEQSDAAKQSAYLSRLLNESDTMNMEFVIWWTVADFDTLWNDTLMQDPLAQIWKDIGLYDQNQSQREALTQWTNWFNRQIEQSRQN